MEKLSESVPQWSLLAPSAEKQKLVELLRLNRFVTELHVCSDASTCVSVDGVLTVSCWLVDAEEASPSTQRPLEEGCCSVLPAGGASRAKHVPVSGRRSEAR